VQFACGRIGAVFLPLNTRLTVPELQYIVGDAAPVLMIHDADLAEVALSVANWQRRSRCCWDAGVPTRQRSRRQNRSSSEIVHAR
jgi:acyl-CoA synthetase (AMP-forming)/AMP-acid ligase II